MTTKLWLHSEFTEVKSNAGIQQTLQIEAGDDGEAAVVCHAGTFLLILGCCKLLITAVVLNAHLLNVF